VQNPGSAGKCVEETVSSRVSCVQPDSVWGGPAFPYLCATHNSTYTKDDNAGARHFIHPTHYGDCGDDARACLVTSCQREDDADITRHGSATGIVVPELNNNPAHFSFSVTCGQRKKLMVCPLTKGTTSIEQCAVKKTCGSYSAPVPRSSDHLGIAVWGTGIGGDHGYGFTTTALTSTHASTWGILIHTTAMKSVFTATCAQFCGFY